MIVVKYYEKDGVSAYVNELTGSVYISPEQLSRLFQDSIPQSISLKLKEGLVTVLTAEGEELDLYNEGSIFTAFWLIDSGGAKAFGAVGVKTVVASNVGYKHDWPRIQEITTRAHWKNGLCVYIEDLTEKPFVTFSGICDFLAKSCDRDESAKQKRNEMCCAAPLIKCTSNRRRLHSAETVYDVAVVIDPAMAKDMALVGVDQWLYSRVDYKPINANKVLEITYQDSDKSIALSEDDFKAAMEKATETCRSILEIILT